MKLGFAISTLLNKAISSANPAEESDRENKVSQP
jgi:hypothetical protein